VGIAGSRSHQRIRRPALISSFRIFWAFGGIVFVVIGAIGVILPLLPTTPFLLLAAYCFARSSPRLHDWLLTHKTFGPLIKNWDEYGSIDPRAKRIAMVVIMLTPLITIAVGVPWWALAAQLLVLGVASTFILTRPDPPTQR
jgi:uncharacterized membrane protein YbaN (DUF454 family)